MATSVQIGGLLEKMTNIDKDFRYMAVNDLIIELGKPSIALDEDMEKRIVRALLTLIQDKNGEVQNLACRCLGPLIHKIKLPQLESMVDALCTNLSSPNEQLRDVSSIALKTVLNELPAGTLNQQVYSCIKRVVPKLIDTLKTDSSIKLEILDVLASLILRYGRSVNLYFEEVESVLFQQLEKSNSMRKRAISALGHLTDVVPDDQFRRIMQRILSVIADPSIDLGTLKTFILASITICRVSAARFAPFLSQIVPTLIKKCENDDDELRENCLQAFETFFFRCTNETKPYAEKIETISKELLTHDPNYNYGPDDDETEEMEMDTNLDEADEDQSDDYSDDDDLSWKVRRAAAKCIDVLITYRPEALWTSYDVFGTHLINRFKEREENVKYEVFTAYAALLKLTKQLVPELAAFQAQNIHGLSDFSAPEFFQPARFHQILEHELNPNQQEIFYKLKEQTTILIKNVQKEIKGKNVTTRLRVYDLLSNLLRAYPGILTNYLDAIVANIRTTLADNLADGNMKIETMKFATLILNTHATEDMHHFVNTIVPLIAKAIEDQFYKTSGEALVTTQSLLHVLSSQRGKIEANKHVQLLYAAIISKLKITDIDQEVKEKTISTAGLMVSLFATELGAKINDECLPLLLDRLRNEMTRLSSLKSINTFVNSPAKLDLQSILPDLLTICSEFLRKNQRSLRLNTLILLESLVTRFIHNGLQGPGLIKVVKEIPQLISEQDLQISQIALTFITDVTNSYPDQILAEPLDNLFNSLISLLQSSLLQGSTLNASLKLLTALIRSPLPNKPTFEEILKKLSEPVYLSSAQLLHRQSYSSIAKATATVVQATSDKRKTSKVVKNLQESLSRSTNDSVRLLAILSLGEIGRCTNMDSFNTENRGSEQLIIDSFASPLEEIKSAASLALGSLATGNLRKFLPFLLSEISKEEKKQYLFLHALKEVINNQCGTNGFNEADGIFKEGVEKIWDLLINYCNSNEESIRNVVAECIGRLCAINSERYVKELLKHTENPSANVRATVITALRFIIVDQPREVDQYLAPVLDKFLATIRDEDLNVRRVAIVTLNSAAHNKPKMVKECLPELLPALYNETNVKKELVREVEMGPFKHIVDDGLDLRKAAFECMYTLADHCLDRVDLNEYLEKVENGIKDCHDIKLLTYLMLSRLVNKCPIQLSQRLDGFCEHIKPQLLQRPKQNQVKQETDKQEELKRSAVRVVIALRRVPNSDRSQKMADLWEIINSNPELQAMKELQTREQQIWGINGHGHYQEAMELE